MGDSWSNNYHQQRSGNKINKFCGRLEKESLSKSNWSKVKNSPLYLTPPTMGLLEQPQILGVAESSCSIMLKILQMT